jgi:recombinational DNA repair protein RecT
MARDRTDYNPRDKSPPPQQGNSGQRPQTQQQPEQPPMRQNEVISAEQKLHAVLAELEHRAEEFRGVLPNDIPLPAFMALINQALRANPKLLRCTFDSIINACAKAAYDGLRIDGKEAAIIDSEERYQEGGAWKSRMVARYMPMVFGLIKQILNSGAALTVKAVIVYKLETTRINPVDGKPHFMLLEGTNPGIHHSPIITGEDLGPKVGVYAVAEVVRGVFKHEWMPEKDVLDVQTEAKTKKVWERWPSEMWKKSAIRRIRKSLNGTSAIRDMELTEMFPQFDKTAPHPQLAAPAPRPARGGFALDHQPDNGVPLNLGSKQEPDTVDNGRELDREPQQQRRQAAPAQQQRQPDLPDLPEDDRAWNNWGMDLETKIAKTTTADICNALWKDSRPFLEQAPNRISRRISEVFTDRIAELATDGAASQGDGAHDHQAQKEEK